MHVRIDRDHGTTELHRHTDRRLRVRVVRHDADVLIEAEAAQAEGWHAGVEPARAAAVLWATVHGIAELYLHGALPGPAGVGSLDDVLAALATMSDIREGTP